MLGYRSGYDRKIGMYFAFLVVALVGAAASFAILSSIEDVEWEKETDYSSLIEDPAGAKIPDTR